MATNLNIDLANMGVAWTPSTNYKIKITSGFVKEAGNNLSISPEQLIDFSTPGLPIIASTLPIDNAINVLTYNITITFDRIITKNSGNIYLYEVGSPDVLKTTISINSEAVILNGSAISFDILSNISASKSYYIKTDAGIVKDAFSFLFPGITNITTFNFTMGKIIVNDQPLTLTDPEVGTLNEYGISASGNNTYTLIGAPAGGSGDGGIAYVYTTSTGVLSQTIYRPTISGLLTGFNFGRKVAISGGIALISIPKGSITSYVNVGAVAFYTLSTGILKYSKIYPIAEAYGFFGQEIAIDGDYAVIGSTRATYVYRISTGVLLWTVATRTAVPTFTSIPYPVAISGNYFMVGANVYSITTGALVFTLIASSFTYNIAMNGSYAIVNTPTGIFVYNVTTGALVRQLTPPSGVSFTGIMTLLGNIAIVDGQYGAHIYDISTGDLIKTIALINGLSADCYQLSENKFIVGFNNSIQDTEQVRIYTVIV